MKWSQFLALMVVVFVTGWAGTAVASDSQEEEDASLAEVAGELTEHSDPRLRSTALIIIGHLGDGEQQANLEHFESADGQDERLAAGIAQILAEKPGAMSFAAEQLAEFSNLYETLQWVGAVLPEDKYLSLIDRTLDEVDARGRTQIFRLLATGTGPFYERVTGELTNTDEEVRDAARRAVVATARESTLDVVHELSNHRDADIRRQLLDFTDRLAQRRELRSTVVELLEDAAGDSDEEIRMEAARQLVTLGEEAGTDVLVSSLRDAEPDERVETLEFLLQYDVEADIDVIRPLIEEIELADDEERQRERQLLYELAATDADGELVDKLREMFSSTLHPDRIASVRSLGRTGRADVAQLLVRGLGEGRSDIRRYSARGLGHLGDTANLNHLRTALNGESDPEVRLELVEAIGQIRDAQSVQILRFLVTDRDPAFRMALVDALDTIGLPESLQALDTLLRDRDPQIQWRAFLAYLRIDADAAQGHLSSVLRNPPEGFSASIEPYGLTDTGRELLYTGLLSHRATRVRTAGIQHTHSHRDFLFPVARALVTVRSLDEEMRRELVHLVLTEDDESNLEYLDEVAGQFAGEPGGEMAAWYLARQRDSEFDETFEVLADTGEEGEETVMSLIARLALEKME